MAKKEPRDIETILCEIGEAHLELKESHLETERAIRELKERLKETNHRLEESHLKTDHYIQKLSKDIHHAKREFKSKWGSFMENLIEGDLVSLLRNQGLTVINFDIKPIPNVVVSRGDGTPKYELDLIVKNGDYAIVVEVKTTLTITDVNDFLEKLNVIKDDLPAYKNKTLYACMAYLKTAKEEEKVDRVLPYLEEQGLFAIRAPGGPANIATIENSKNFIPKKF